MMRHALAICALPRRLPLISGRRGTLITALFSLAVFTAVPVPGGRGLGIGQETTPPSVAKGTFLGALPHDTTLFLRASNVKGLVEKLKKSPFYGLKDHPDVKDVLRQIHEKLDQGLAEPRKELGFDPLEILSSAEGECILALGGLEPVLTTFVEAVSMGQSPNLRPDTIPLIIAVDAGGSSKNLHDRFEQIFQFAVKKGARRETVDFQGGKITRLVEDLGPAGKNPPGKAELRTDEDDAPGDAKGKDVRSDKGGDVKAGKAKRAEGGARAKAVEKKDGSGSLARDDEDKADDDDNDAKDDDKEDSDDDNKDKDDDGEVIVKDDDADAEGEKPAPVEFHFGEMGGRFYFSPSRPFLEMCMGKPEALAQAGGGLDKNAPFQEALGLTGHGDFMFYVNVKQLTNSIGKAVSTSFVAFFWQKIESIIFGKSFNNLVMNLSLEEKSIHQRVFVHNSGAPDGILALFRGDAFSPSPPAAVIPATAKSFSSGTFNPEHLGKIVKEIFQTYSAIQGGQGGDIDAFTLELIGVKLTDLVNGLGKRFHTFATGEKSETAFGGINWALELRDEAPVKKLLKKFESQPQLEMKLEKFKDTEGYSVDLGQMGECAIVIANKMLIFTGKKSEMESVVARFGKAGPSLAENEDFKKAVAMVPARVSGFSYSAPDFLQMTIAAAVESAKSAVGEEEARLLSSLSVLGEILGTSTGYSIWNDKGLYGDSLVFYRKKP